MLSVTKNILFLIVLLIAVEPCWAQQTKQNTGSANQTKQNTGTTKQVKQNSGTTIQAKQNDGVTITKTKQNSGTTTQPKKNEVVNTQVKPTTDTVTTQKKQPEEANVDTIILVSGKRLLGKIHSVSSSKITYYPIGKSKIEELARKQINRILYSTGRMEFFNKPAFEMVAEGDFKTIVLTENPEEVNGLYDLGPVKAQSSKAARNAKSAQQSADIRLQKKAANMGAYIVLIKKRESKGGYGEVPTHFVEGEAYGLEPPKEQPKK